MLNYILMMLVSLGWLTTPQPGLAWAFGLIGQYWSRPRALVFEKKEKEKKEKNKKEGKEGNKGEEEVKVGSWVWKMLEEGIEEVITESGFGLYFGDLKGKEVIFEGMLNRKQYKKVLEVLSNNKAFTVFEEYGEKFVMHHGNPSGALPEGVGKYCEENDGYVISCFGASHPHKRRHVCPVNAPLWVSVPIEANFMGTLCPVEPRKGGYKLSISVDSRLIQH